MTGITLSNLLLEQINKQSPIRQIMKFADETNIKKMGLRPEDVISFGGGWVNHKAPEAFREEYIKVCKDPDAFHLSGAYSATLGDLRCREAIARYEKEIFGMKEISAENIIVGMGSTQLTHDVFVSLANPADTFLFLDPTYANYPGQVEFAIAGAKMVRLPVLDTESWSYTPDISKTIEDFKEVFLKERPKLVVVPTPDNPTSQMLDERIMKAMVELTAEYGSYLILDMAYKTQYFGEKPPSYFSWSPEDYENLVTIHSNSKWCRGLGRRLGWIEANLEVISALERVQQVSILCPDTLHQMTMTSYLNRSLEDGSLRRYLDEVRRNYELTAKVTLKAIDHYLGFRRLVPQGGLYTVMDVETDAERLVPEILKNTGVLFIPGIGFGKTLRNGVRISYGPLVNDHEKIKEGMERVGKYLERI